MSLEKESLTHKIEDDLALRNRNWDKLTSHLAANTTQGNPHGIDAKANKAQEAWLTPTLLNGWENLAAPYAQVGYYKDEFGVVHLKGFVRLGVENTIFILPSGYRPTEIMYFSTLADNNKATFVVVNPSGSVDKPTALDVTSWISLNGISFKAGV